MSCLVCDTHSLFRWFPDNHLCCTLIRSIANAKLQRQLPPELFSVKVATVIVSAFMSCPCPHLCSWKYAHVWFTKHPNSADTVGWKCACVLECLGASLECTVGYKMVQECIFVTSACIALAQIDKILKIFALGNWSRVKCSQHVAFDWKICDDKLRKDSKLATCRFSKKFQSYQVHEPRPPALYGQCTTIALT